jgi:MtN3 and saliva related transmembrane protein
MTLAKHLSTLNNVKFMNTGTDILGLIAGICTAACMVPQLVKTLKTKKAGEMSAFLFLILSLGNALWAVYGFMKSDIPIVATNIFSCALNIVMLVLKLRYKE